MFAICFIYNALKTTFFPARSLRHVESFKASRAETSMAANYFGVLSALYTKWIKILWNINCIRMSRNKSMAIGCNIWMICLKSNWFFNDPCRILKLSEFVVFNNFLLSDATDRSKISSDQKRHIFAVSPFPFHFSRTLPIRTIHLSWVSKSM